MPRKLGKYSTERYIRTIPKNERFNLNFYYLLNALAHKNPEFRERKIEIKRQQVTGKINIEEANNLLWNAVTKATKSETLRH